MRDFHYFSFAQEIIFGHAAVTRMEEALPHLGVRRLMLCTEQQMRANGHAASLEQALGDRLVASFDGVTPRIFDSQVEEVAQLAEAGDADAIIGLGSAAPLNMAKAVAFKLEEHRTGQAQEAPSPLAQPLVPAILIPTTYSGTEMTPVFLVRRSGDESGHRVTTYDPKIAAKLVVYDPQLTVDMPADLTASSGINALAHCFEALYSITRHPVSAAAALDGLRKIHHALPACFKDGADLAARSEMLAAAHLAAVAFSSVAMGLHHGLCHVLGEAEGVPHGIADGIVLPHAIRFNAEVSASDLLPAARALGISVDGQPPAEAMQETANRVSALCAQLGLPQRLRDVGIKQGDLHHLAELAFQDQTLQNNPRRIDQPEQIEALLKEAW